MRERNPENSSIGQKLKKMTQEEFFELYYSPYVLEDFSDFNGTDATTTDKDQAKKLFTMIAKRKAENERLINEVDTEFMSSKDKGNLRRQIKNNTRVIWHLRVKTKNLKKNFFLQKTQKN